MRTIKFRVIKNNKIVGLLDLTNYEQYLITITEKQVLEQFTGLLDKNGVEIYEGDIVKSIWNDTDGKYIGDTYIVKFGEYIHCGGYEDTYNGCGWYAEPLNNHDDYRDDEPYGLNGIPCDIHTKSIYSIEVIGNIREAQNE